MPKYNTTYSIIITKISQNHTKCEYEARFVYISIYVSGYPHKGAKHGFLTELKRFELTWVEIVSQAISLLKTISFQEMIVPEGWKITVYSSKGDFYGLRYHRYLR